MLQKNSEYYFLILNEYTFIIIPIFSLYIPIFSFNGSCLDKQELVKFNEFTISNYLSFENPFQGVLWISEIQQFSLSGVNDFCLCAF